MESNKHIYLKLFTSTFLISAFTFGGGYVIVPLLKKKFVNDFKWIDEKEMLDMVAIAQSSPGVIAVNTSIIIGYKISGFVGALFTIFGTILPPLIIMSIVSLFYIAFKENIVVNAIMKAMRAGVAAVIVDVTITMIKGVTKDKSIASIIIMILAFIAAFFLNIDVMLIILFSGIIGGILLYHNIYKKGKQF
ncbi:MAG: chromate transporter [Clostridiales bacterium GWF2_38_85]|nr:MAG: chromate transporter [Clostridiales bacterium GWF2_38_85]HBL85256.1 chromate transporter [Clostridiales bacterium]